MVVECDDWTVTRECDDCGEVHELRQWRKTHFTICEKCALIRLAHPLQATDDNGVIK